ncbi:hypothetical protein AXK11_06255 [Cephaloticoccus primus]|uniref:UDP-N-acetylmuramoyl-tripeptide--D-alanyl-D-alanine ligase n=1 Tax=Cephaloticoccus primus TaxID=1548207 RepID=A0A139SLQ5_9BACT|nr:UDP-N-acetylmuramoyl-tripeptide--D-alanyl-D-alanine ligase [Cephaloticoccus primus]KXU35481.1 hypothetical protein AXK11_06255 [Cephaloticoccus primus]
MTQFDPDELAKWSGGRWTRRPGAGLCGFAIDTRQLRRGQVFVALKTEKRDGHDFLAAAAEAGAAAALVSRADSSLALPQLVVGEGEQGGEGGDTLRAFQKIAQAQRAKFQAAGGRVIGVTGSVGKTSTKNLLAALLGAAGGTAGGAARVLATEGNLNNHLGVPLTLTRIDPAQHRFAVVEAGISEPGEMAVLAEMIGPDVAIITAVAAAHLEELGDVEGVAREKAILAAQVRENGLAIFPAELRKYAAFAALRVPCLCAEQSPGMVTRLGREGNFTTVQHALGNGIEGKMELLLADQSDPTNGPVPFPMPKTSKGMANNAALAIRAALHLGVDSEAIRLGPLRNWTPASLRGEWRREPGREIYLDCYNANPASMADALEAFCAQAPTELPRLFVLGGMEELGAEAAMHHRALGRSLSRELRPQDRVFAIGEEAEALRQGVVDTRRVAPDQIEVARDFEPVRGAVARWRGAIFLKASRRYRLETLLSAEPSPAASAHFTAVATGGVARPVQPPKTTLKDA